MELAIRKLGNSTGIILPPSLLRSMHLAVGNTINAEQVKGKLVLTPNVKPKYTLAELLEKCDSHAAVPQDVQEWDASPVVGREGI
ncbi:MAG: AbrB/MazE/SpoVT family DNA-binding domain-containing protein [Bdellovibrionota bacterium]|jgi:antitoxin ChpS